MHSEILSSIKMYPTSNLVYSSMSAFAHLGEGELPGGWFVNALSDLGHSPNAIRQTLFRLTKQNELVARKSGRQKFYSASTYMVKEISFGLEKIFIAPNQEWDGLWTMVQYSFEGNERNSRERLRSILSVLGFAPLGTGLLIHPRDYVDAIREIVRENDLGESVRIFRSKQPDREDDMNLVRALWNLEELAEQYRDFLKQVEKIEPLLASLTDQQAFQIRFYVTLEILNIAWNDPDLPASLEPSGWPGNLARAAAKRLYEQLLDPATAYARGILRNSAHATQA